MKVRDTSRGRMYAVSSNPGCTVINGDMAVDVPAGGQSVILALDKKLIIDGDDDAKFVEVRWGTNAAVGSRPAPSWMGDVVDGLVSIVGEGKFDINYIPAENKLYLQFSLEVTSDQVEDVKSLLARVLPSNVVQEISDVPITYTRLEYIENTMGGRLVVGNHIIIPLEFDFLSETPICTETLHMTSYSATNDSSEGVVYSGDQLTGFYPFIWRSATISENRENFWAFLCGDNFSFNRKGEYKGSPRISPNGDYQKIRLERAGGKTTASVDDVSCSVECATPNFQFDRIGVFFKHSMSGSGNWASLPGRKKYWKLWLNNEIAHHLIPALDPTGAPCMFDLVSRKPFYNSGTGDFLYPGKEEEPTTYSMRKPRMYAQYTEHGIRRLYHVPEGYNGSKEEYAAEHGFKLLVETPQPEEGYWAPVWHDREDCIELEWIETEAPTEEELQIEEIENA